MWKQKVTARLAVAILAIATLVGCNRDQSAPAVKEYDVKGKVTGIDVDKQTVKLDHEAIPGLMGAMEMDIPVASKDVLNGIAVGEEVTAKLKVESGESVITKLQKRQ